MHFFLFKFRQRNHLLTIRAYTSKQSLCNNTNNSICNHVTLYIHICQTGDRTCRTICMQRAYYQVTGNRRFNGNISSLLVTDLTDHDDVRILTQDRTKCRCKGKSRLRVGLYLIDPGKVCLYRVLYGDNINALCIQFAKCRIQCRRFTTTGWSCYKDNTVRVRQDFIELC